MISALAIFMTLLHGTLGCCGHHAHGGGHVMLHHDRGARAVEHALDAHDPAAQHAPEQQGEHDEHSGEAGRCVFVGTPGVKAPDCGGQVLWLSAPEATAITPAPVRIARAACADLSPRGTPLAASQRALDQVWRL